MHTVKWGWLWLLFAVPAWGCRLGPPSVERAVDRQLFSAVAADNLSGVRAALAAGANVNFQAQPWGLTPLVLAARLPLSMSQLLLDRGASVNLADAHGRTPLMKAVYRGNTPVVQWLLRHDARVDAAGPQGKTALFYAIVTGRSALVRLLLQHHAAVNRVDDYGDTPLSLAQRMLAAARGIFPVEQKLMMDMRPADSMFMRSKATEIRYARQVLALTRAAGATLGQQPAKPLSVADACRLDERSPPPPTAGAPPVRTRPPA